jgi:excisionase family DNA binding protein
VKTTADRALTVSEVAVRLGVHPDTVKRSISKDELPFFRTSGGHRRFLAEDVRAYIERRSER